MGVTELRHDVVRSGRALYALLVLSYQLDKRKRDDILRALAEAERWPARRLRESRDRIAASIKSLSRELGCKLSVGELEDEYIRLTRQPGMLANIRKCDIEKHYFTHYAKVWEGWDNIAPHAFIVFDSSAEHCGPQLAHQYYLPEAALYEDMCFAYNNAASEQNNPDHRPVDKMKVKQHNFYLRSAILAAFYFIEAYLNGIAFDFAVENWRSLSEKQLDRLLEWNSKKGCPVTLKFRDKLLQYPKIIIGAETPPLTETTCPELRTLLTEIRPIRDSIVHQTPRPNIETGRLEKPARMIGIQLEEGTRAVDCAVRLVRRLNDTLGKGGHPVDWLFERDGSGLFPKESFS